MPSLERPSREWRVHDEMTVPQGTAEPLSTLGEHIRAYRGVLIQASLDNNKRIYVGPEGVTTGNGIMLDAGDSVFLPLASTDLVFAITTAAGQKLRMAII